MIVWVIFLATFATSLFLVRTLFYGDFTIFVGLALISWFLADIITKSVYNFLPRRLVDGSDKAILITGCDTGFGHELAKRLDKLGFVVYAGCLLPQEDGARKLKSECSDRLHILPIDVTKDELIEKAAQYVKETLDDKKFLAIINNAGIAAFAEIEWCPIEVYQNVINVNTLGPVRMTKAFLPLLRESKGRVVIVSSLSGRYTFPGFSPYSMSKHATVSFADGLRLEMKKWGISVHSIEPTLYKTPISAIDGLISNLKKNWAATPIEVQESYGEEYFKAFQEKLSIMTNLAKVDINEVVEDIMDAAAGEYPKTRYVPGTVVQMRARLLTAIPTELQDFLLCQTGPKCPPAAAPKALPMLQRMNRELRRTQSEPPGAHNKHLKTCM